MKIRFLRGWRNYEPGKVLEEFHDGMADLLIIRGIVEEVKAEPVEEAKKPWRKKSN